MVSQEAGRWAKRLGLRAVCPEDRSLLLKLCALQRTGKIPEYWLADAGEAVRQCRPENPWAYLHRCVAEKAEGDGRSINALLAAVEIPAAYLE
ncbi:MAG: hypothetical protein D6741_19695, partial [Planctomycetota bacterium]